jgi:hypothetical protein
VKQVEHVARTGDVIFLAKFQPEKNLNVDEMIIKNKHTKTAYEDVDWNHLVKG